MKVRQSRAGLKNAFCKMRVTKQEDSPFKGISLGIQRKREGCYEYGQEPEEFGEEKG